MSWYNEVSKTPNSQIDWDAVKQQSDALSKPEANRVVAKVPKFTAVKEGQQHPMGKNGQFKLFHEHMWPKGFTPQRRDSVSNVLSGFVNDEVGTDHSAHLQNKVVETVARSTVPEQTLSDMAQHGSFSVSEDTSEGEFDSETVEARINPNVLGHPSEFNRDGSGTVASQMTMHELGHMNDYLSDPDDFWNQNNKLSWYSGSGGLLASPALEGRAEGFRLATTRITRGMRRGNDSRLNPTAGYSTEGFDDPVAQKVFNLNRVKSFRHASGLDPLPQVSEKPAETMPAEQPILPGMKKYMKPSK